MEENKILRLIYTFFLGLLLAIFVGLGISTFYAAPVQPAYPVEITAPNKDSSLSQTAEQQDYDQKMDDYNTKSKTYERNTSIMALIAAVALLCISLISEKKLRIIADGVMLGSLFTLLYSLGRGFASEDSKYTFVAVSISLVLVLYLGYHRFVQSASPIKKKRTAKK
jgi:amino acid transporter